MSHFIIVLILMMSTIMAVPTLAAYADEFNGVLDESIYKKHQNIESGLMHLYEAYRIAASDQVRQATITPHTLESEQTVRVVIVMDDAGMMLLPTSLGIDVETTYENLIQATIPINNLEAIADYEGVKFVRLPFTPSVNLTPTVDVESFVESFANGVGDDPSIDVGTARSINTVTSEGTGIIRSDLMNDAGYDGSGIKVAIIDKGFDITNPEIAGNIVVHRSFWVGGTIVGDTLEDTRHGTAVAEIIVDMAPDVDLYLYNFGTGVEFLNLVDHLISLGDIDVVSVSIGWYNNIGPIDGTSIISEKVSKARDSGILWINAVTNDGQSHWKGQFTDNDFDGFHNFGPGDETLGIDVDAGELLGVILSWDDWDSPSQDYELLLFDANLNTLLHSSTNNQFDGSAPPYEIISRYFSEGTTAKIVIKKFAATRDVNFRLVSPTHDLNERYQVASSSISIPEDSPGSFSVGAYYTSDTLVGYSSQGPTDDGRIKPDISGITGTSTSAYYPYPFYGTSAATPHVSGAAALVMDKFPDATADQIQNMLEYTTKDYHPKSNLNGTGRVDLTMFPSSDILILNPSDVNCAQKDSCLYPQTLRVEPGDEVMWVNSHNMPVRITNDANADNSMVFDSGVIDRGGTYSVTFDNNDTFTYIDQMHPWATGTIIVGSGIPNDITSEGTRIIGSDLMNDAGYDGSGIKVAIIDSGFDITNPEIAGNIVEHRSFWAGGTIAGDTLRHTQHGTAVAEIIVDMAPDVDLYLYNFGTGVEFLNLVDHLINLGDVNVVSMSRGLPGAGPIDGTGTISKKVSQARDSGILWINAAGNYAQSHWQGQFTDNDFDGFHNFGPRDETLEIDVGAGEWLDLRLSWDDWDSPSQDYELWLVDANLNTLLHSSNNSQYDGSALPYERIAWHPTEDITAHIVIKKFAATRDVNFHLVSVNHDLYERYQVAASSISIPADAPGSFSVGAYSTSDTLKRYSSQGPTDDGRIKPDISGITDTSTSAYYPRLFTGTSAATPHVSGAAALVMDKFPDATADQIQNMLEYTTKDYHSKSNLNGTGRVDLSMFPNSDILVLNPSDVNCAQKDSCLYPQTLRVEPGDEVMWVNAHNMPVRITNDANADSSMVFDSGVIDRRGTYPVAFDNNGTFTYIDQMHPWATGTIIVGSGIPDDITSEGTGITGSDLMNDVGHDGSGIKVAIIDAGFDITNPEISGNIREYRSFWVGSTIAGDTLEDTRHGTAVAEIIVDMAPDVDLYLYNYDTGVEFLNLVDHLINLGDVDVASMSLGWSGATPMDGTSTISKKVSEARDSGILWINAAGNKAQQHWQGQFTDNDFDGYHDFGLGDNTLEIDVDAGKSLDVRLSWDDWDSPSQDYELWLVDANLNTLLDSSENNQYDGSAPPFERILWNFSEATTAQIVIEKYNATRDVNFHLFTLAHDLNEEYQVAASSIFAPADSPGSFSVGAYSTSDTLERYSSQGPTDDGRIKPDISGITGTSTSAYYPYTFYGTSAATSHVSGAAALVMDKFPDATADQIQNMLEYTTKDYHPKSNLNGTGRVDLSMFPSSDILVLNPSDVNCAQKDSCLYPQTLRVEPGDEVMWVNAHNMPVRITNDANAGSSMVFDSGVIDRGERYSVTFDNNGTFTYIDQMHPWATGTIIVGSPPPPQSATVAGYVFNDTNRNQILDVGESGIPQISTLVHDYASNTSHYPVTGADGRYNVTGIVFGQTALSQIVLPIPENYLPSGGIYDLASYTHLLEEDNPVSTINFPLYYVPPAERGTIMIDVYHDLDGDGEKDGDELGVAGVTVYTFELLTYATDVQVTDQTGITYHDNLNPDVVLVQVVYSNPANGALLLPEGFARITTANAGFDYIMMAPGGNDTLQVGLGR